MTWKGTMFAVVAVLLVGILTGLSLGQSRTVSWSPVTSYVDGTPIETSNLPVRYDVKAVDNVTGTAIAIASNVTATSTTFDDSAYVKGRKYNFHALARTQDGASSAWSPPYEKVVRPFQEPATPAGLAVQ